MFRFGSNWLITILNKILILISLLAIGSLIAEYGFYLSWEMETFIHRVDIIIVWYFVLQAFIKLFLAEHRWEYFRSHWFDYLLVFFILSETALFINVTGLDLLGKFLRGKEVIQVTKIYIVAFQISIVLSLFSQGAHLNEKIASYRFHPAQVLMGSFLIIILIGTALLSLPRAVKPGNFLAPLDALFTATSATCVTGLVVVDTGQHFSRLGQLIILTLIQIGGLGLMTYASFFALILRRSISLKEKSMIRDMLNYENMGLISRLLSTTILFTFFLEALGAVSLFIGFEGRYANIWERIYSAIFHSVSAFCNAGFSLQSDSFMSFRGNYLVISTLIVLIVLGGLGFPVLLNLSGLRLNPRGNRRKLLTVQTRLVLVLSGALLFAGFVFFLIAEGGNTLYGMDRTERVFNALFQSVTARTAGFNTLNIGLVTTPSLLFFLFLMFVGASPGSTGGGIKTTTFGILFAGVWSVIRGRNRIELFRKNIPFTVLNRALVIILFSGSFIFIALIILNFSENLPFVDLMFEAFSAFGTVGLSRGITPLLSSVGKAVIIVSMFFGRLGALTISLAITAPRETYHYDYPPENVMVG